MSFRKIMMIASMATVLMTTVAMADENAGNQVEMKDGKPVVRVCTSPKDDLYGWAGGKIAANLSKDFTLINVRTNGAHDNLEKVANGECLLGFTQTDVRTQMSGLNPSLNSDVFVYGKLYREAFHLICNRAADISRVTEVPKKKLKIYGVLEGSGTADTLRTLLSADTMYAGVQRIPDTGVDALRQVLDPSNNACYATMDGLNSDVLIAANTMSVNATPDHKPALMLVNVDDRDMKKLTDADGNKLYEYLDFKKDGNTYKNLLDGSTTVPTTYAELIVNNHWRNVNKRYSDKFNMAVQDALPTILARTSPNSQLK